MNGKKAKEIRKAAKQIHPLCKNKQITEHTVYQELKTQYKRGTIKNNLKRRINEPQTN